MSNFQEFIENVKAGKVVGVHHMPSVGVYTDNRFSSDDQADTDHLCAHIRRWLTGKGVNWGLYADVLVMDYDHERFDQGSELDWHIDAANWVCKQGVEG
jgi:hypothetical protein